MLPTSYSFAKCVSFCISESSVFVESAARIVGNSNNESKIIMVTCFLIC